MNLTQAPAQLQGDHLLVLASAIHVDGLAPSLRDQYIRDEVGLQPGMYFQVVKELLDDSHAAAAAPAAISALRTLRASRTNIM